MRDELLRSWRRIIFFWSLAAGLWWGISNARIADAVRALGGKAAHLTPLDALSYAWWVVEHWTFPVLAVSVGLFFFGYGLAHYRHRRNLDNVREGVTPDSPWRGMKVSIGWLPHPGWEMREPLEDFHFGPYQERFRKLPATHQKVLLEILSVISAYPAGDAYVGPGHTDSLLEHTLGVLQETWDQNPNPDSLLPLLAAAHDMGKIRAFVKVSTSAGVTWKRHGWHDEWSARLFSGLPSFWQLPEADRQVALVALRYGHKFSRAPLLPMAQTQRLVRLHELLEGADRQVTAEEKQAVLSASAESLPELVTRAFLDALQQTMRYYGASLPKGFKANIWRNASRVYISEPGLREALVKHLPENIAAAISTSRTPGKFSQITEVWVEAMRVQGWLVEALPELGHEEAESGKPQPMMIARPPIWNVRSGTINLNGMFVVNVPIEEQYRLGANAPHRLFVLCPTYDSQGRVLDTKGISIPAEYLEASQAENGKAMKALEDDAATEKSGDVAAQDAVTPETPAVESPFGPVPLKPETVPSPPAPPEESPHEAPGENTPRKPAEKLQNGGQNQRHSGKQGPRKPPATGDRKTDMALLGGYSPGGDSGDRRPPRGESQYSGHRQSSSSGKGES